ncbi:hypothetical protein FGO68_gene4762 [Halteria grandinella]|uniref:Protein kinase domain-containing protein n=1 Tax=Halteria grandinella TaxID=5974 RepID=A0A8J8SW35_HALGN|nr:hypothetical protein FGO68_gene4762 [Halteria grandinella]
MVETSAASLQDRYHLIERISDKNAHGTIYIATKADASRHFAVIKLPNSVQDGLDISKEYHVMNDVGRHPNIIEMIEFNPASPFYMATHFAKAKCLYSYLAEMKAGVTYQEKWSRYFFRQVIEGVLHLHRNGYAHMDLKIDNIFCDYTLTPEPSLTAMVADFGMVQLAESAGNAPVGNAYGPPEVVNRGSTAFNFEKADVFACSFILLALIAKSKLGDNWQCQSEYYRFMQEHGGKSRLIWPAFGVSPSAEFQDLLIR